MTARSLFVTRLYEAELADEALLAELADAIRDLAEQDKAGLRWSRDHGYKGYTSYASLDDLPRRNPSFADLKRMLERHAAKFADDLAFEGGRKLRLDSIWVNLMKPGGHHSAHIHPHSTLSGTLYVEVPPRSGPIRFEDPRLPMMMAAPVRREDASDDRRCFVSVEPRRGQLLLWESWLRHEVLPGSAKGDRLSISFNFR